LDQAPKVAAIKRLASAAGAICISDAAKQLQVPPSKLFQWLERTGGSSSRQLQTLDGLPTPHHLRLSGPQGHCARAIRRPVRIALPFNLVTPKGLAYLAEKNIGASL
jgi:hypothetical protein